MIKAKRSHSIGRQVTESKMSQLGMLPRSGFVHLQHIGTFETPKNL
jgi:hypothetical protein